jgi:hypothetical protein
MAKESVELISAIRRAANRLEQSNHYQWGHMGACNCGFLAQEITRLRKEDIHRRAMMGHGDWTEQLNDYCPTSGLPMDDLISELLAAGLSTDDLKHLERLSDPLVLRAMQSVKPNSQPHHNRKSDVSLYMHTWANVLEAKLIDKIQLPDLQTAEVV